MTLRVICIPSCFVHFNIYSVVNMIFFFCIIVIILVEFGSFRTLLVGKWLGNRQIRCNWATKSSGSEENQINENQNAVVLTNGSTGWMNFFIQLPRLGIRIPGGSQLKLCNMHRHAF